MNSSFQDPWVLAKARFTEGLEEREKEQFRSVKVEDVLYAASAAQKRGQENSKAWYMAQKLMPIVDAIGQYGAALDVISNSQSSILCPLWGSIRVVLTLAESFGKYHDKLLDMFERIGDVLPRFSSYAKLFPNEAYLLHALSQVYVDILEFCTAAKNAFLEGRRAHQGSTSRLFSSSQRTMFKLVWKPFDKEFGSVMERFRRHKANVEREAGLSHMIEASNERTAQSKERQLQQAERSLALQHRFDEEMRRKAKRWNTILSRICSYRYERRLRDSQQVRHAGTCDWIFDCERFKQWISSKRSSLLWVYGKAGSGKTILSARVAEKLKEDTEKLDQTVLLSFICDFRNNDSLRSTTIIQGFLKQMLLKLGQTAVPESLMEELDIIMQGEAAVDFDELTDLFFKFSRIFKCVRVVIDGIDECDYHSTNAILKWITQVANFTDTNIGVFISSRNDIEIKEKLSRFPKITFSLSQPKSDLRRYISEKVESLKKSGKLRLSDPSLYETVINKLAEKSDGMFLWVSLQLKDILDSATDVEVKETLDNLPVGLYETYERGLLKVFHNQSGAHNLDLSSRAYYWLYHAKRPLTLDELVEAIGISIGNKQFSDINTKFTKNKIDVIRCCGNLVDYNEEDGTVTFFHYSFKQYISEIYQSGGEAALVSGTLPIATSICTAEQTIAALCIVYLSFSDFEVAIVPFKGSSINSNMQLLQQYASTLPTPDLENNSLGKGFQTLVRGFKLLNGISEAERPRFVPDFARYIYRPEPPSTGLLHQYKLLDYAREFWLSHAATKHIDIQNVYLEFTKLCFDREMLFGVRPWGKRYSQGVYAYTDALVWALENNHALLVLAIANRLQETNPDHWSYYRNLRLQDGSTLLHLAAKHLDGAALKRWVEFSGDLDDPLELLPVDGYQRNILHIAIKSESLGAVTYMMNSAVIAAKNWYHLDSFRNTPFDYAIENHDMDMISLIRRHIAPNSSHQIGWSITGDSEHKCGALFIDICTSGRSDLYEAFIHRFNHWDRRGPQDNHYYMEGLKLLVRNNHPVLLGQILTKFRYSIINGDTKDKRYAEVAFEQAIRSKNLAIAQYLLESFPESLNWEKALDELCNSSPIDADIEFLATLGPYSYVIPSLLVRAYGYESTIEKSSLSVLPSHGYGSFPDALIPLRQALVDLDIRSFMSEIDRLDSRHLLPSSEAIPSPALEFLWSNIPFLFQRPYKSPDRKEEVNYLRKITDITDVCLYYTCKVHKAPYYVCKKPEFLSGIISALRYTINYQFDQSWPASPAVIDGTEISMKILRVLDSLLQVVPDETLQIWFSTSYIRISYSQSLPFSLKASFASILSDQMHTLPGFTQSFGDVAYYQSFDPIGKRQWEDIKTAERVFIGALQRVGGHHSAVIMQNEVSEVGYTLQYLVPLAPGYLMALFGIYNSSIPSQMCIQQRLQPENPVLTKALVESLRKCEVLLEYLPVHEDIFARLEDCMTALISFHSDFERAVEWEGRELNLVDNPALLSQWKRIRDIYYQKYNYPDLRSP